MPNEPGLKIKIGADLTNTLQSLIQVSKQLGTTGTAFQNFTKNAAQLPLQSLDQFRKSVGQLKTELAGGVKPLTNLIPPSTTDQIAKATTSLKGVKPAGNEAALALSNVGRVAQDLPFGFLGIQNNLNPLLESFQRLKAQSGSNVAAFKALGASLLGAGGIGLALSAVSAAVLIYQNGISGFNRKTKEAKEVTDSYKESLKSVSSEIGNQAAKVSTLVLALEDTTKPLEERKEALKQLKSINADYFGALTLEKGAINGLTLAYQAYLSQLDKLATAKAIEDKIAKLFSEKIDLDLKFSPKIDAAASPETIQRLGQLKKQLQDLGGEVDVTKQKDNDIFKDGNDNLRERLKIQSLINQLQKGNQFFIENQSYALEKKRIEDQIAGLRALQKASGGIIIKTPEASAANKKDDPVLKQLMDNLEGYQKQLAITNKLREEGLLPINRENDALQLQLNIIRALDDIDQRELKLGIKTTLDIDPVLNDLEVQKALKEYSIRQSSPIEIPVAAIIKPVIDVEASALPTEAIPQDYFKPITDAMERSGNAAKEKAGQITVDLGAVLSRGFENAAIGIGESIGNILSGLDGNILQTFGNVLGDMLTQLGKMFIETGVKILALQEAAITIAATPAGAALAIAAGIAAIAAGKFLKNSFRDIKPTAFALGGIVTSPRVGLVGEAGPEAIIPLDRLSGMINPAGNSNQPQINVGLGIRGREIVAFLQRETTAYNRTT